MTPVSVSQPPIRRGVRYKELNHRDGFTARSDLFSHITAVECERLERQALTRTFRQGEMVYFPGDPGRSVLLLARGRVKIKDITPDGKEIILAFIEEGDLFGESALLGSSTRNCYAQAVEDSQVFVIPREDLLWLMEQKPVVALRITKLVGLRLMRIENRLRNVMFRSIRERVVLLLLELVESHGQRVGDGWEIRLPISHQDLASLIGATRETVTVTLGQLQLEGLIQVRRRHIAILDRDRLASESSGTNEYCGT
ncbi:MAG: Crp/Fnr family transcriptional regulator [Planctomycetes bacterium]|nr:Crp/Fnr family transcriptional regulator [Planctomycetota bacterium]